MTLEICERPNARPIEESMETVIAQRIYAKRAFLKAMKETSSRKEAHARDILISVRQTAEEWDRCAPLQQAYLDAGLRVIKLAVRGNLIKDSGEKCLKVKKNPAIHDICQELDQLFFHVVSKPTRMLRQCMDKSTTSEKKRRWAHGMLQKLLSYPMLIFFKAADILGSTLMVYIDEARSHARLRAGLLHSLMYISDCYRYLLEHQRSKNAAELMRIIAPGDAEAHMRVAINSAMLYENVYELSPFFHYCAFLANRKVSVNHREAVVVSRYVHNVRLSMTDERENNHSCRRRFISLFIDTLWSLLTDDFDTACEKVKREELWNLFRQYLNEGHPPKEMLLITGCLIFVHFRISPQGNEEGNTLLQFNLTEALVCRVIYHLSDEVCTTLNGLNQLIRGRKKKRRRALQKKRKPDGGTAISAEALGYELLKSITPIDSYIAHLGSLTFLTHYWSKSRIAPRPNSDFNEMANVLQNLRRVVEELVNIEKATCTSSFTGLIGSRIIADASSVLPAMTEDVMFCNFDPCQHHKMLRNVLIQEVPLPSILRAESGELIKTTLRNLGESTYETRVFEPVQRHLEAFGQQCLKEAGIGCSMDKESSSALVILTVRKFRIHRLILGLEKVGGGKLSRMIAEREIKQTKNVCQEEEEEQEQPPAAQTPDDEQPTEGSILRDLTSRELGSRLRKRRRLIGTSTPADVRPGVVVESNSLESSRVLEETRSREQVDQDHEGPRAKRRKVAASKSQELETSNRRTVTRRRSKTQAGGMLSQGSFQLTFTPPVNSCENAKSSPQKRPADPLSELSRILRGILYPTPADFPSPPRNLRGPAFWRNSPSDDYSQIVPINQIESQ